MGEQEDLRRRVANLEKMIQVTRALREAFDLQSLLTEITNSIAALVDCEKSSILLVNPQTNQLYFASASGTQFSQLESFVVPPQSIAGTIVQERKAIVVDNAQTDPRFFAQVDHATGQITKTLMGVPMEIGGRVIGALEALNKKNDVQFDEQDIETLLMFAPQAAAAIENTRLIEEQQQRLADEALIREAILTLSQFIQKEQLFDQLADLIKNALGFPRFSFWEQTTDRESRCVVISNGFQDTAPEKCRSDIVDLVIERRDPVNIADIAQTPQLLSTFSDTRSVLAVPMLCGEDLVGVISVESEHANAFSKRDERILFEIALQTAIGIRQSDLYEASLRANQVKQEFIATMSHELRTPMTVVISSCEMIAQQTLGPVNKAQLSTLQIALERANLLLRLLNDILDFSKIASGDLQLYPTLVNLPRAVEATVGEYGSFAERKNQSITINIPRDCRHVLADGKRLRQVLGHLIDNAIKFSNNNSPIAIQASPHEKSFVRVDVIDQGIGIKPEDLDLVFEDFRQLDNSFTREFGGAGMGLAISKHLIELQGGIIWVESEFGQGSTFSFILPRPESNVNQTLQIPVPGFLKRHTDR